MDVLCVFVRVCTHEHMHEHTQGEGKERGGRSSRAGQKNHQEGQEDNMEKLEGPEHSEAFVRRWKLGTGMIPKQKNLPRDPVL